MSYTKTIFYELNCDNDGCEEKGFKRQAVESISECEDIRFARRDASKDGWGTFGKSDFCSKCMDAYSAVHGAKTEAAKGGD